MDPDLWDKFIASTVGFWNAHAKEKTDIIEGVTNFFLKNNLDKKARYIQFLKKVDEGGCMVTHKQLISDIFTKYSMSDLFNEIAGTITAERPA